MTNLTCNECNGTKETKESYEKVRKLMDSKTKKIRESLLLVRKSRKILLTITLNNQDEPQRAFSHATFIKSSTNHASPKKKYQQSRFKFFERS